MKWISGKVFALIDLTGDTKHFIAESIRTVGGHVVFKSIDKADVYITTDKYVIPENSTISKNVSAKYLFVEGVLKMLQNGYL